MKEHQKCPYVVLYEDEDVLCVYKKQNVFTVKTDDKRTFTHNLYYYLRKDVLKKEEELFVLHRLDYETSGIVLFVKSKRMHALLQREFLQRRVIREYEAVIKEDIFLHEQYEVHQLLSDSRNVVSQTTGKEAITFFEATNPIQIGTALKIQIKTGRKNQIRIALHDCGFTLIGDKRYSHSTAKRMYLNEFHLGFSSSCPLKVHDFFLPPLWIK